MARFFSDKEIVDAIIGGDKKQLDLVMVFLYQEHAPSISRFIMANSGSEEAAADVFQDTLVVFYMKVRKGLYEQKSSLKTYLFSIAKNLWLKELRKQRITFRGIYQEGELLVEPEILLQESHLSVKQMLDQVGGECKQLLLDFYFSKKPVKILTQEYGLGSDGATKNKKYRCLQKLTALIKKQRLQRSDFKNE